MIKKWLSKIGTRFLYGMAVTAISFIFLPSPVLFIGFIGMFILFYGFFTAISVIDAVRCKYLNQYTVMLKSEVEMKYILVQANYHAYAPIIMWVCFYFYAPYKKEYYLVPIEGEPGVQPRAKVSEELIHYNGAILLTDADHAELMKNPQAVLDRIVG